MGWQISRDTILGIIKINQSIFIKNLVIKKKLIEYNSNVIPVIASFIIDIREVEDYKKTFFQVYQPFINKLMYLVHKTKLDIVFGIRQLSKYNTNLKNSHL